MAQNAEARIQCALSNMLNDVDKQYLRKLKGEMHKCAAKCCEDKESSVELVHACIQLCNKNLKTAQEVVQNEFFNLQRRLQSCVLTCNNEARKNITKKPLEEQIKSYSQMFDSCVEGCVNSNISLIPYVMKKMKEILSNKPPGKPTEVN